MEAEVKQKQAETQNACKRRKHSAWRRKTDLDRSLNCLGGGLPDIISLMQIYLPFLIQ